MRQWLACALLTAVVIAPRSTVGADGRARSVPDGARAREGRPPPSPGGRFWAGGAMEISVDDWEDRIEAGWSANAWPPVPAAAGSECTLRPSGSLSDAGTGNCTLRGALWLANAVAEEESGPRSTLTLVLRGGIFRLSAPLPEITGSVVVQGVSGHSPNAEPDPYFSPAAAAGQSAPIGSVIDGQERFQILRVGRGARLALRSIRLERGRAVDDTGWGGPAGAKQGGGAGGAAAEERRAWAARTVAGGAVNSLGTLEMDNVGVRMCAARDGGAVYAEGFFVTERSLFQNNFAVRCGGFLYAGGGASASVAHSSLEACTQGYEAEQCGKRKAAAEARARRTAAGSGEGEDTAGGGDAGGDAAAGALTEGEALSSDSPPFVPFSARQEAPGSPTKPYRQQTTRQLRSLLSGAGVLLPEAWPKDHLAAIAHDLRLLHPTATSNGKAEGQGGEDRAGGGGGTGGGRAAGGGGNGGKGEGKSGSKPRFDLDAFDLDELEAQVASELAAASDPRRRAIRLKTARQLRELLIEHADRDEAELEGMSKEELQSVALSCTDTLTESVLKPPSRRPRGPNGASTFGDDDGPFAGGRGPRRREEEGDFSCDGSSHGGSSGEAHTLRCGVGLWRTGRKMQTDCVGWRAARKENCDPDGERYPGGDRHCFEFVPRGEPGFCECAGGAVAARVECEHAPFTCAHECRRQREMRRRLRDARKRSSGVPFPPPPPAAPPAYAIGAFGTSSGPGGGVRGLGLLCSDGSRTAVVGVAPTFNDSRGWWFVCPGWKVCEDAHEHCSDWARTGECSANPGFMREGCAWSCNACPPFGSVTDTPLGLVALDVEAGRSVDSLRLRCGTALGEEPDDTAGQDEDGPGVTPVDTEGEDDDGSSPEYGDTAGRSGGAAALNDTAGGPGGALEGGDTAGGPSTPVGPARVSSWIGRGRNAVRRRWGSSECRLDCDGTNATAAAEGAAPVWRGGGLLQALTVAPGPGSMLARIELTRCSEDLDEMDEV